MRLTLMLCDHVAVADGKLFINGGGWNTTGPQPSASGIAALIEVPWDKTNKQIPFRLRLHHEDGEQVTQLTPLGAKEPIEVGADIEVGRPAGLPAGTPLLVPLAINLPGFALVPDQGYYWQAELSGESREDWRLSFRTRPGHKSATDPTALPPAAT